MPRRQLRQRGFTLFEVLISMLILSVAILSVALLLPTGLRAQESARYKAIAAVTALNLVGMYEHARPSFNKVMGEGFHNTHNVWSTHEPGMYDIERFLSSSYHARNAVTPVPPDIARRLDSDDDEIQTLLDEGGYLYFPSPLPVRLGEFEGSLRQEQLVINVAENAVPYAYQGFDESQRLVIGFVGYAQQNAIPWHPMTMAPGREYYPTAPLNYTEPQKPQFLDMGLSDSRYGKLTQAEHDIANSSFRYTRPDEYPGANAPDQTVEGVNYDGNLDHASWGYWRDNEAAVGTAGFQAYDAVIAAFAAWDPDEAARGAQWHQKSTMSADDDLSVLAPKVEAYFVACENLVTTVIPGFTRGGLIAQPATNSVEGILGADVAPEPWQVAALRYYGHAAMWLSRFVDGWQEQDPDDPAQTILVNTLQEGLSETDCMAIHEHSLRWVMHYRAHRPYDWGVPRPFNSATMMDHSLLQVDLFNAAGLWDPNDGSYLLNHGGNRLGDDPPGYRIIAPRGCTAASGGNSYAVAVNPSASAGDIPTNVYGSWWTHDKSYQIYAKRIAEGWGRSEHFNLLNRFQPAERCRQMVVWAVDWQRYEDAERAPAAPTDASWYPYESTGTVATAAGSNSSHEWRHHSVRKRGRPEMGFMGGLSMMLNWKSDPTVDPSFTEDSHMILSNGYALRRLNRGTPARRRLPNNTRPGTATIGTWLGREGLDANGNGRFDRGTVPASLRMRATVVTRFNIYDSRVWASVRN